MVKQKLMMWVRYEKILDAKASRKKIEKCQILMQSVGYYRYLFSNRINNFVPREQ